MGSHNLTFSAATVPCPGLAISTPSGPATKLPHHFPPIKPAREPRSENIIRDF